MESAFVKASKNIPQAFEDQLLWQVWWVSVWKKIISKLIEIQKAIELHLFPKRLGSGKITLFWLWCAQKRQNVNFQLLHHSWQSTVVKFVTPLWTTACKLPRLPHTKCTRWQLVCTLMVWHAPATISTKKKVTQCHGISFCESIKKHSTCWGLERSAAFCGSWQKHSGNTPTLSVIDKQGKQEKRDQIWWWLCSLESRTRCVQERLSVSSWHIAEFHRKTSCLKCAVWHTCPDQSWWLISALLRELSHVILIALWTVASFLCSHHCTVKWHLKKVITKKVDCEWCQNEANQHAPRCNCPVALLANNPLRGPSSMGLQLCKPWHVFCCTVKQWLTWNTHLKLFETSFQHHRKALLLVSIFHCWCGQTMFFVNFFLIGCVNEEQSHEQSATSHSQKLRLFRSCLWKLENCEPNTLKSACSNSQQSFTKITGSSTHQTEWCVNNPWHGVQLCTTSLTSLSNFQATDVATLATTNDGKKSKEWKASASSQPWWQEENLWNLSFFDGKTQLSKLMVTKGKCQMRRCMSMHTHMSAHMHACAFVKLNDQHSRKKFRALVNLAGFFMD